MEVQRRSGLTRSEFVNEFLRPNQPVIFTDLSANWEAHGRFSFEYFRKHYASLLVDVRGCSYPLGELLDRLEEKATPDLYPCKLDLRDEHLSAIAAMVEPRPAIICPDRTNHPLLPRRLLEGLYDLELFFGGEGGEFPYLHYDYLGLYAIINQIHGEKEFTIFPPEQQEYLYPKEGSPWISRIENHHAPDLERYPLFRNATPTTVVLKPGESLFIPKKWYHTARSLGPTISVAMDQLCHFNWAHFKQECLASRTSKPLKRGALNAYLSLLGHALSLEEKVRHGI